MDHQNWSTGVAVREPKNKVKKKKRKVYQETET